MVNSRADKTSRGSKVANNKAASSKAAKISPVSRVISNANIQDKRPKTKGPASAGPFLIQFVETDTISPAIGDLLPLASARTAQGE